MTSLQIAHEVLCHSEPPFLKHFRRGRFTRSRGVSFTGSVLPGPGFNFASCTGDAPPLAEVVAMAKEFFDDPADVWGVLVAGDLGHPIESELRADGWTVAEDEPAYVLRDLERIRNAHPKIAIRPVQNESDRAAFLHVAGAAFGAPAEFADLIMPSLAFALDAEMVWLLAEKTGANVAVGGSYRIGSSAVICCLATLDECRGEGIGTAMMQELLNRSVESGSTTAVLRSSPKSCPLYERLGFEFVCQHRTYVPPNG